MAVINVKEDGMGYHYSATIDEYGRPIRTMPRVFTVLFDGTDLPVNRPILAANATGIPLLYSTVPLDPWLYVYQIDTRPLSPILYEVVVNYKSIDDPLAIPPVVQWGSEVSQEPIDKDVNGKPIANSAKQTFDPPIQENVYDKTLTIDRNEGTFDHDRASLYEGSINSDTFYGFAAGKVLCRTMKAVPRRVAALTYYEVHYEFVIRKDGWKRRLKDQGLVTKDEDGNLTLAKDSEGGVMTEPVPLDGNGKMLAAGAAPVWLEFDTKKSKTFGVLGLA